MEHAMTVLVIDATAHGSTPGVAERIAARPGERGVPATARPAGRPDGLDDVVTAARPRSRKEA
jgi:flavodoxin